MTPRLATNSHGVVVNRLLRGGVRPNRSFDTDTQGHCAERRAREHTLLGAMPLRAGQLQRYASLFRSCAQFRTL